jgi:hypothetical protein
MMDLTATPYNAAMFRQIDKDQPARHHDALEFPDGQIVLLTHLAEGQHTTVLQLPAKPAAAAEAEQQTRAVYSGSTSTDDCRGSHWPRTGSGSARRGKH